jgi:hypothetical protein
MFSMRGIVAANSRFGCGLGGDMCIAGIIVLSLA